MTQKVFVCRLCQQGKIKLEIFKEHSQKCFEIAKLKEDLRHINDWLLKECEKAKILRNNIGFDLLIANHITKRGSDTMEDDQKSIELKLEAQKKARVVAEELSKSKFNVRPKKCPTTGDFSTQLNSLKEYNKLISRNSEDSKELKPSLGNSIATSIFDSQDSKLPLEQNEESKPEEENSPGLKNSSTEKSGDDRVQRSHTKPSRFKEIYKKPSGKMEIKIQLAENNSQNSEEKSKKSAKDGLCFGDTLPFDDEKSDLLDHSKEKEMIPEETKSQDLQDSPDIIDKMFSDKSSAKGSEQGRVDRLPVPKKSEEGDRVKIPIFESLPETRVDQLESPKAQNEKPSEQRLQHGLSQVIQRSGLELEVQETQSVGHMDGLQNGEDSRHPILVNAQSRRVYKMSKFSAMRGHKNFSTQVFQNAKRVEEEQLAAEPAPTKELNRDIKMAKICSGFFDKLVK